MSGLLQVNQSLNARRAFVKAFNGFWRVNLVLSARSKTHWAFQTSGMAEGIQQTNCLPAVFTCDLQTIRYP